jgi:hypothetical protein
MAIPAPSLTGELPPPDASVPPRPPEILDAKILDVAAVAGELGLACESFAQSPEMGASYQLSCHVDVSGASLTVRSNFWAPDYVDDVVSVVLASGDGAIEAGRAEPLFVALAEALVGNEPGAVDFVRQHVDDPGCADEGCELATETATVHIGYGMNGARQLTIGR